jgi:hypothetical protein
MEWIELDHDRDMWPALMNAVMNLRVPQYEYVGNVLTISGPVSFSRRNLLHGVG